MSQGYYPFLCALVPTRKKVHARKEDGCTRKREVYMKEIEIERKFLMDRFPSELFCLRHVQIEQGYVSVHPEVRIHRAEDLDTGVVNYRLTMKDEGDLSRTEIKTNLDEEFYLEAKKMIGFPMIQKEYRSYRLGEYILEVCLVDAGSGLEFYYGEVEFPSEEAAQSFMPIPCLGKEVTSEPAYKMKNYWAQTRLKQKL